MLTQLYILAGLLLLPACKDTTLSGSSSPARSQPAAPLPAPTPVGSDAAGPSAQAAPQVPAQPSAAAVSPNSTPVATSTTPLTGLWDATGYTCEIAAPAVEIISITQTGTQFVGTKVTGDACVPQGYISFQGTLSGGTLNLHFNEARPGGPVSFGSTAVPGSYTPTLIHINSSIGGNPPMTLTPHQS